MLRFGIQLMQPKLLMQHAMQRLAQGLGKGGLSVDVAAIALELESQGFSLTELNPDLNVFFPQSFDLPAIERLRRLRQSHGLRYTVHLPLWSLEPASPVEHIRRASVDFLVESAVRFAPLEPEVYVLHATGALAAEFYRMEVIRDVRPLVLNIFQERCRRSVEELLERTGLDSRQVAVETIEFPLDLTLGLAEELDLSVCLDTGHVLAGFPGVTDLEQVLPRVLPRLAEVHLHDGYRRESSNGLARVADHLPVGQGELPLERLLDALEEAGFDGPVIFELNVDEAHASLDAIRACRPHLVED